MPVDYYVRPMRPDDVPAVERLTDESYLDADVRDRRVGDPEPAHRSPERAVAWRERVTHLLGTDPRGCWVAEDARGLLGSAVGMRRELTWLLASYAVRPGVQGRGVGRQLLDAAQAHGSGCLRAMVSASDDPAALRRYRLLGLDLHPLVRLRGPVPREALPVVEHVRDGSLGDVDLMDSVDRQVRLSAHGPDHALLARQHRLVVVDRAAGSGYAYVASGGGPSLLAATHRRTAVALLWETLAASSPDEPVEVGHVSATNPWAVDVGLACRMPLGTRGFLALRGMRPPAPYLPSGHFL